MYISITASIASSKLWKYCKWYEVGGTLYKPLETFLLLKVNYHWKENITKLVSVKSHEDTSYSKILLRLKTF